MFNPEKLIKSMMTQAMGGTFRGKAGKSRSSLPVSKASIATALLGVGIAAFEHFRNQSGASSATPPPSAPRAPIGPPPPPPPGGTTAAVDSLLLIRAMIAAAHADGHLDEGERIELRRTILKTDLDSEEKQFIEELLSNPPTLDSIVGEARTPQQAEQLYAVSVIAINVDTEAERQYLQSLAKLLKLSSAQVARIHDELGVTTSGEIL